MMSAASAQFVLYSGGAVALAALLSNCNLSELTHILAVRQGQRVSDTQNNVSII